MPISGPGPVFVYESMRAARRWQVYAARSLFVFLVLLGMVIVWLGNDRAALVSGGAATFRAMAKVGQEFFYALAGVQISLVMLAAPAAAAGAICTDRTSGALAHMFVTDLSDTEIVLGKLGAHLTPIAGVIVCGLPVAAIAALLGGIDFGAVAGALAVSLALALLGCVLALAISLVATKTHEVLMAVYMIEALWLLSLPIWWASAGPPPAWFQKSNPYVLVFAPYNKPGFASAIDYALFVGVAAALAALLVAITISALRSVVVAESGRPEKARRRIPPRLARLFPTLAGPSLDGNPVLWREWHRNRPSRLARRIWEGLMAVTALVAAVGTYDVVLHGHKGRGPNGLGLAMILQVTFGFLMVSATAPTVLAEERVRGSLDVLLATPLATRSIVVGKWWGVYRRVLLLAPIPLYVLILTAATVAGTPKIPAGRLVSSPVPLMPWERFLAPLLASADFLSSGALLVSLGVALATWIRRLGRAVAFNVIAFFMLAIGLVLLGDLLFRQVVSGVGAGEWVDWLRQSVISMSPIVGPVHPIDILLMQWETRTPRWISAGVVSLLKATLAVGMFNLTVRTFDRSLGRVREFEAPRVVTGRRFHQPHLAETEPAHYSK
jgi:hypothetical protein